MKNFHKHFGSFIPLETNNKKKGSHYHQSAKLLNTARNALFLLLSVRKVEKVYLPFFSCDALYTPLDKLNIQYEFYSIDRAFYPIFDFDTLNKNDLFLYINYFGLNDDNCKRLSLLVKNLIIDNSQSFFSPPLKNISTIYSARKFFGVADGAYLYDGLSHYTLLPKDVSYDRYKYLLLNLDLGQKDSYALYKSEEEKLDKLMVMGMSDLTSNILSKLPYERYKTIRIKNYNFLHDSFKDINLLKEFKVENAPLCYPLMIKGGLEIKRELIKEGIFLPTYWNNVLELVDVESFEAELVKNILPIHIDHRYGLKELKKVVKIIKSYA